MRASRRETLQIMMMAAATGLVPRLARAQAKADPYDLEKFGNVRVLHQTDTHAQASPVYFREPSANIGIGAAWGRPPHLVGKQFLDHFHIPAGGRRAYAFTYLDFEEAAHRYGALGGFAHLKTLQDRLRAAVPAGSVLTVDGGDLLQGSALADDTKGAALVELGNMLGLDLMTGHWEFTYGEAQLRKNIAAFKGEFIAQNVFLTDTAAFNNAPAFDAASGRVFRPYAIKEVGGFRVATIGQAFPYVPIAHPARFVPDWSFGIHDVELQAMVEEVRGKQKADVVLLLSHNGMDVDLKLASRVRGIDVILGGHTHDAIPQPSVVSNAGGKTLVTNAGSNGKFLGVLDLEVQRGQVAGVRYTLLPVFANLLPADPAVAARITALHAPHAARNAEKLAEAGELLYRRGNFNSTMDQVICDAVRAQMDCEIALSPGFRWGTSVLSGQAITMNDVLAQTAITYPDVYVQEMTGAQLKSVMEDVCDNLFNPDPFLQQGGDMVRVGGMDYACAPSAKMGSRISDMTLDDGSPVDPAKTYKVAGWASVSLPQTGTPVGAVVAKHLRESKTVHLKRVNQVKLKGITDNPGYAGGA
ncbi:MAG: thiosulfohydrolase SoxB [Rhodospirillales bacterium]|nr:thiosulfohydrolase SoxB [Rhodospirillales bacterium]